MLKRTLKWHKDQRQYVIDALNALSDFPNKNIGFDKFQKQNTKEMKK